jgi:hypothetical protein
MNKTRKNARIVRLEITIRKNAKEKWVFPSKRLKLRRG